ncbi:transcriptional regulator [Intrasporangium chromatireducens Q5-1]|uniref:Manganese transport regulator n=2 Tax=Intrasporangium TaxID=53357 RepID=W9GLT4_9MICO|nr:metal-dependent transcriptional regulator [Cumulibacter manganitolerans]EWT04864.1 transcriptional regulator [Intrasporangium chromatireducens Q5-1]
MGKMPHPALTRMVEDYLTLIWKAHEWPGGEPSTTDLAAQLGVTASTVSANLKKLARDGHIDYEPYGPISLTDAGRAIAVEIVRRHRIIETYLVEALGLGWDQVHDEADRLEHAISDLVLDRMDTVLGHPTTDPHGDPIPAADGTVPADDSRPLTEITAGTKADIARVSDRSPDVLRYLQDHGITVGTRVRVNDFNPQASMIEMTVGHKRVVLSLPAAAAVRVRRIPPSA